MKDRECRIVDLVTLRYSRNEKPANEMHSISPMHETHVVLRWTPAWVILISLMTPVSAWMLHTVNAEAVPWYLGIMAWLTLTPDRRPMWLRAGQIVVASA